MQNQCMYFDFHIFWWLVMKFLHNTFTLFQDNMTLLTGASTGLLLEGPVYDEAALGATLKLEPEYQEEDGEEERRQEVVEAVPATAFPKQSRGRVINR